MTNARLNRLLRTASRIAGCVRKGPSRRRRYRALAKRIHPYLQTHAERKEHLSRMGEIQRLERGIARSLPGDLDKG